MRALKAVEVTCTNEDGTFQPIVKVLQEHLSDNAVPCTLTALRAS
jgi:hypothetical protein